MPLDESFDPAEEIAKSMEREGLDEWIAQKNVRFEERMVRQVLTHFGLAHQVKELKRMCEDATGTPNLTFTWFHELHPGFPVRLGAASLPYIWQVTRAQLRRGFTKTSIFRAYENLCAEVPDEGASPYTGLLFEWPEDGLLLLHDAGHLDIFGKREVWNYPRPARTLYLDQLRDNTRRQGFLYAVGEVWAPTQT